MRIGVKPGQWGWTSDQLMGPGRELKSGADTLLFVLDDERDPAVISRLATAVRSR